MTETLAERWDRLGALRAVAVVAAAYLVLFPVTLLLDNPARRITGAILFALLVAHCLARLAGGWRVFFLAGLPCATCTLLDDIIALPRETGLVLFPLAMLLAWYEDHPDEQDDELVGR